MNETETLRGLVRRALDERAVSGRQLAAQAERAGFQVTHTTLNHLAAGTYRFRPSPDTVRAVAWAARVPDDVAFAAAGIPMPGPPFAEELPPGVDYLSQPSRRAAVEILRALVRAEKAGESGGNTAATTPPGDAPGPQDNVRRLPAPDPVSDGSATVEATAADDAADWQREDEERERST